MCIRGGRAVRAVILLSRASSEELDQGPRQG